MCGQFCKIFLKYISEKLDYNRFLRNFTDDLKKNYEIAKKFQQVNIVIFIYLYIHRSYIHIFIDSGVF